MEAKNFKTGQFVIVDAGMKTGSTKMTDLKAGAVYQIVRGVDAQNPGTIGIKVKDRVIPYSLFLFKPLSEEEGHLAQLLME